MPQPLPPGLGNLPLYLNEDGFYSVNGPLDLRARPPCAGVTPANHDSDSTIGTMIISAPDNKKASISPDQRQLNDGAVGRFVPSLSHIHTPPRLLFYTLFSLITL